MAETELSADSKRLLDNLIDSLGLEPQEVNNQALVTLSDAEDPELQSLSFYDEDISVTDEDRFINCLASLLVNSELDELKSIRQVMKNIDDLVTRCDVRIDDYLHRVIRSDSFRKLEVNWRSLDRMARSVTSEEVVIDFLDVTKDELGVDLEDNDSDILASALFKKVYIAEYDRYGGKPFGAMVGLYYFDASVENIDWLRTMSKIGQAAHCPFVASAEPGFFGFKTYDELARAQNLEDLMSLPKYGYWNTLRESDAAAYIGLTLPRFMIRSPWNGTSRNPWLDFTETIRDQGDYAWGSSAVLFACNMIRSFESSGWCQSITGPLGGGLVKGLPVHTVERHGHQELQPPVEVAIPDFRELQFSKCGFIPLLHAKDTSNAAFFSARAIKTAIEFEDELDTQNADLVCNLSYTLSITRIAHYVKRMVRDYIGSTADGPYIQDMLLKWLVGYVTTVTNPDDLTLLYFPFKAVSVEVVPKPGPLGWYNCIVSILPHVQFQGMDVELRLEAALGGAA